MNTLAQQAKLFAQLFNGLEEIPGAMNNPVIVRMHKWFAPWVKNDETPWCGAFAGTILRLNGHPVPYGSKALGARQYLTVGEPVPEEDADQNCLVILKRGRGDQPGPEVLLAPGHVAFFDRWAGEGSVVLFGGNQKNKACSTIYSRKRILGVRRFT